MANDDGGRAPEQAQDAPDQTTSRAALRAAQQERRARRRPSMPSVPKLPSLPPVPPAVSRRVRSVRGATSTRAVGLFTLAAGRFGTLREQTRPAWTPVASFLRWISPLGWAVLGLGVVAYLVGRRFAWVEWMMIAGGALVLVLACVLLAVGRTKVRILTEVEPIRVTVGDPATGRIEVTNESSRGMLPILVELPVGVSAARFTLPPLGAGKAHEELFTVPTNRRGVIPVGPATTVQGDPLGLVRRTLRWTDVTDLYVHPRTVGLESLGAGLLRDLEGETTPELSMSDLAFHALREYQPGDDRRYIHWRSSAKAGRLLVRQFLDTRRSHLSVVVDSNPGVFTRGEDDVELAISAAASLAIRAILDEQETTVIVGQERASRTTASLTLDSLSRAAVGPRDLFSQTEAAVGLAPDTSLAILVTGPRRPLIEMQRALNQYELEVNKVVLLIDPAATVGVQHAAGLSILTIGELEDLQRVLLSGALT